MTVKAVYNNNDSCVCPEGEHQCLGTAFPPDWLCDACRPEASCQECGATDTELIAISAWDGNPVDGPFTDLFCADLFACYERVEQQHGGLPL